MNTVDKHLFESNLRKTFTLSEVSSVLKMAFLKAKHPGSSEVEIRDMFFDDMLKRKERQWKVLTSLSKL